MARRTDWPEYWAFGRQVPQVLVDYQARHHSKGPRFGSRSRRGPLFASHSRPEVSGFQRPTARALKRAKLVAADSSSPGLSLPAPARKAGRGRRRDGITRRLVDYWDGRDKPGHDQVGTATTFAHLYASGPRKKLRYVDR